MKILITCLFLLSAQIFSQTYLGVSYNNSDPANSTDLSLISKITFSSTNVNFLLTDNSTVSKDLSIINKITFSGTDGGNPLPVELTAFSAIVKGDDVVLKWSTATELNNYGFEIERKVASLQSTVSNFEKIGFVNGSGTSISAKDYTFLDNPKIGSKYSYRLKQIDLDGKFEYSKSVEVSFMRPNDFKLEQNYPNPFNPTTNITYSLPIEGMVTIKVFDIIGREVLLLVNENQKAGNYTTTFDGSKFSSGVYICKMNAAAYSSSIKMLILK
ncbi:MAG: T9SS type A sorting domain-containing protein [Ignavibacteriota bacterium]